MTAPRVSQLTSKLQALLPVQAFHLEKQQALLADGLQQTDEHCAAAHLAQSPDQAPVDLAMSPLCGHAAVLWHAPLPPQQPCIVNNNRSVMHLAAAVKMTWPAAADAAS